MKYRKMQKMLLEHGWIEENIALWVHPDIAEFFLDGNGGDCITICKEGHWFQGDNVYGFIEDEADLVCWMEEIRERQNRNKS